MTTGPSSRRPRRPEGERELHVMRYVLAISLIAAIVIVGGLSLYFRFAT